MAAHFVNLILFPNPITRASLAAIALILLLFLLQARHCFFLLISPLKYLHPNLSYPTSILLSSPILLSFLCHACCIVASLGRIISHILYTPVCLASVTGADGEDRANGRAEKKERAGGQVNIYAHGIGEQGGDGGARRTAPACVRGALRRHAFTLMLCENGIRLARCLLYAANIMV